MSKDKMKKNKSKNEIFPLLMNKKQKLDESINWLKFLEPTKTEELIVHPKKLDDIKKWFVLAQNSQNRILLLIGPPGCAKLMSIKCLAKEYNYDVAEWTVKQEIDRNLVTEDGDYASTNNKSQSEVFQEFLLKSSRYQSIFSTRNRLLIVKDFPSIFMRKGNEDVFLRILKKFKAMSTSPLIFILTETNSKSLNIEYNLFPETVRCQLAIDTINMNPIAVTSMKKTLKSIAAKMKEMESSKGEFTEPTLNVIDDICVQSQGDIRNAIMNLQMVCQKGSVALEMLAKTTAKTKSGGKAVKAPKDKITKGVGRDENVGILHGVGRALFPKRKENPETKQVKLTHCPEILAECFSSQPSNYIELLHSNYLKNFSAIEDVSRFTEYMSCSDLFQAEYRDANKLHILSLNLAIRAAMICNTKPPKGFRPISAYASKKFRSMEERCLQDYLVQSSKYNEGHRISVKDYFLDYASLVKTLKSSGCNNQS